MSLGSLKWNAREGEGQIYLSPDFFSSHRITQLDCLSDWMAELNAVYEAMLEHPTEDARGVAKKALAENRGKE